MRLGCFGCLILVVLLFVVVITVAGVLFLSANIYGAPDFRPISYTASDGYVAQNKLYEIVLRQSGRSSRQDPVVITDREVNAFLARHLKDGGLPMSPLAVRFSKGQLWLQGQTSLRHLFQAPGLAQLVPYLPARRLDEQVWITVRGQLSVEPSLGGSAARYGKVEVSEFWMGRQPISPVILYVLMGPTGAGFLRWQVPSVVETIEIEDGQALIRTR
ncbi:MAG TPA: hypothetical protein VFO18_17980 [Methylomirabilota bacterium]|nr:hypothetical protein [Methylomirabilota bacterium]